MSENINDEVRLEKRKRRVKRFKHYLITLFLILLITPNVISIVALNKIVVLNKRIDELSQKVDKTELTYMLMSEANETKGSGGTEQQPDGLHFEYYVDDYEVPDDFRKVYLTFDDGPSIYTTQILDILDTYGVKATFFVTGQQAQGHPEWYQEIVGRGHTIGMHSYTHIYSDIYESSEKFEADFNNIHDYIKITTGIDCKYYRFPGGSSNTVSSVNVKDLCVQLKDKGVVYFDWNVSSQDASSPSLRSNEIADNVISGITKYNECIVLMHDAPDKYSTVQALPSIIESILGMDKTVILQIDDRTKPIQHLTVTE